MNIFKVFASAKKGFQEEYASAILAWLLHPDLEHGLGFSFLSEFVAAVAVGHPPLTTIIPKLVPRLRSDGDQALVRSHHIEFFVPGAFVDVVVLLGDWVLAIENKIFPTSVQEGQLKREYDGLRQHASLTGKHIGMLYLVPHDEGGPLHPNIEKEFTDFRVQGSDFKQLVTWQANDLQVAGQGVPSVVAMIKDLMAKEAASEVTPITEYMRHTLKALCQFIADDFSGYDFEPPDTTTGLNPRTEEQLNVTELATRTEGFVGVKSSVAGLLKMKPEKLTDHPFQYTRSDMTGRNGWLPIDLFNQLVKWQQTGTTQQIQWDFKLPFTLLSRIAKAYGERVFIGIRGGQAKLREMSPEHIAQSKWRVRSISGNAEWIRGDDFHRILVERKLAT
jgi:hypothetical protein